MNSAIQLLTRSLTDNGKLIDEEIEALGFATQLLAIDKGADKALKALGVTLNKLSKEEGGEFRMARSLLKSKKLEDRMRGSKIVFEKLASAVSKGPRRTLEEVADETIDKIGAEALRSIPTIEHLYRSHLRRMRVRRRSPEYHRDFEDWLRSSRSHLLPKVLQQILTSNKIRTLSGLGKFYTPGLENITTGLGTLNAILKAIKENGGADLLFRKMANAMDAKSREQILEFVERVEFPSRISSKAVRSVFRADGRLMQGNAGEGVARTTQLLRLRQVSEANPGKPIYLLSDVQAKGTRTIVDKIKARSARKQARDNGQPLPTTAEAKDVELPNSIEFSDGMIASLGGPEKTVFKEVHEVKVTKESLADGAAQHSHNAEVMALTTEISAGRVEKFVDGKIVEVKLSELSGYAQDRGRLIISESENFGVKVAERNRIVNEEIVAIEKQGLPDKQSIDRIEEVLRRAATDELSERKLLGLKSAKRVVFTPTDHFGELPEHFDHETLGFAYKELIDFCNLVLHHGGFRRLQGT